METIIGIRGKKFPKKELALPSGQLIFWLVETIFFFSIFRRPLTVFFRIQWKSIFQGNPYFRLVEMVFRANNGFHNQQKAVNKRILFPIDRNSDPTSQNEGFVKRIRFHYAEKLLSPPGISTKARKTWFPIAGEKLLYKKWLHLDLNNGFHQHKICSE